MTNTNWKIEVRNDRTAIANREAGIRVTND